MSEQQRTGYVTTEIACTRLGLEKKELIRLCDKHAIPMQKKWGVTPAVIDKVYWAPRLSHMWAKKRGDADETLVVGQMCDTKDAAVAVQMSSAAFISWCRKHHVEMGLDIEKLQGYVPWIMWTEQLENVRLSRY